MRNKVFRKSLVVGVVMLFVVSAVAVVGSGLTAEKLLSNKVNGNAVKEPFTSRLIVVPRDYPTIQDATNHVKDGDTVRVWAGTHKENGDRIGDTTYYIHDGENKNRYPLMNPSQMKEMYLSESLPEQEASLRRHLTAKSFSGSKEGNTITVDDEGDGDYTCIQDAIDNATSGDTIEVYSGFYRENVKVYKTVKLKGIPRELGRGDDEGKPVIDGGGKYNVVIITADDVNVSGFTVQNAFSGLMISSDHNSIQDNIIIECDDGIWLDFSSRCTVTNNTMMENGILLDGNLLDHWNTHTIDTSNTVNGKPVYYWKNVTGGSVPTEAGQVILANCTGVTIENQDVSNGTVGIQLGFSSSCTISRNIISNNSEDGIYLVFSSNNTISQNTISNSTILGRNIIVVVDWVGIYLYSSSDNTISGNIISNNIGLGIVLVDSSDNTISGNTISNNSWIGIYLCYSSNNIVSGNTISNNSWDGLELCHSSNNVISKNTISNNSEDGIYLWCSSNNNNTISGNIISNNCYYGIRLDSSSNNIVSGNTISNNSRDGIHLHHSSNNIVSGNTISNNSENAILLSLSSNNTISRNTISNNDYGIYLNFSSDSMVTGNNFIGNHVEAAFYTSFFNLWFNNYWDNWKSSLPRPIKGTIHVQFIDKNIPWVNFDWSPAKKPHTDFSQRSPGK